MDVIKTAIPDIKIFVPAAHEDARGAFSETFNARRYADHLPGLTFIQDNESRSAKPFTIRGLHFQTPPHAQAKLVRVVQGRIFDVVVDIRKGSPTYGQWVSEELTAENRKQLLAPVGFLHGFMTLAPDTVVSYKVTNYYDGPSDSAVHWASPSLNIAWPASAANTIHSEKDATAIDFDEFDSPFSA